MKEEETLAKDEERQREKSALTVRASALSEKVNELLEKTNELSKEKNVHSGRKITLQKPVNPVRENLTPNVNDAKPARKETTNNENEWNS